VVEIVLSADQKYSFVPENKDWPAHIFARFHGVYTFFVEGAQPKPGKQTFKCEIRPRENDTKFFLTMRFFPTKETAEYGLVCGSALREDANIFDECFAGPDDNGCKIGIRTLKK
jgi:hypothetical protein